MDIANSGGKINLHDDSLRGEGEIITTATIIIIVI
jgi:hypothetical protein